ncbi:MAG: B12-binding domain-containing radical SAM protein [candidate division KSB1 bacterium]|nr:B12-binding domain-containing radical SAM protein [candidate division KSB1 bacterium]
MRILFLNPPYFERFSRSQRSPGVIKSGTMYYPYWLASAAAVAESRGHEIDLIDCPASRRTLADIRSRLLDFAPDLIVLESVTASWYSDCAVAGELKAILPESAVAMFSTHVTALWRETLERHPAVDYVCIGEYDLTVAELAQLLEQGGSPSRVLGLAYRRNGEICKNAERPLIENLDDLPWIAPIYKRFLNPNDYYFNLSHHPMVMLIGGRGCTAMCFYCVYPQVMHGHRYRHRSPENIVGEMLWVQENMPEIREITFEDDNFAADPPFARRFAQLVKEKGVRLPFFANLRTTVDFETLRLLKEAGLHSTAVGFESGDDRILRNMRKGQNTAIQQRFVENAHKLGILVHGCFMVGFPGETRETMKKTLQLAIKIKPDSAQFYPVMPYPGTGAYAYYKEKGFLATDSFDLWLTAEGGHRCVLNLPGLPPEEIERFCERAFRRFHFRPGYLWYKLRQAVRSPREGRRSFAAGLHFVGYLLFGRRRRDLPFKVKPILPSPEWYGTIRVPMGRMEALKKATKRKQEFSE